MTDVRAVRGRIWIHGSYNISFEFYQWICGVDLLEIKYQIVLIFWFDLIWFRFSHNFPNKNVFGTVLFIFYDFNWVNHKRKKWEECSLNITLLQHEWPEIINFIGPFQQWTCFCWRWWNIKPWSIQNWVF